MELFLYQKIVQPGEQVLEIKGIDYTIQDVMGDKDYNQPSLVIGIFMSFYDVHINRIPYGGVLKYKRLEPIESTNKPMLAVEKDILNKVINPNNMDYLKYNERMSNQIYVPSLDYTYHIIQIADEDVNVIAPFKKQLDLCTQNERFSLIRWGSQVDLVLPLDKRYNLRSFTRRDNAYKCRS
jgi:phosphatidylserine decarboxylase